MKKLNFLKNKVIILLILFGMLFGHVPTGQAQFVQEWSDPINLSMSGAASNPSMVVDGSGVVHVIWVDEFDGFKYSQSTDGLTWTTPVTVKYPFSTKAAPPVMFTDASGIIHIFWLSDQNTLSYAQTRPDNLDSPQSWRTKVELDKSVYDFDAGIDPQGRVHVIYMKNPAPATGVAGVLYRQSLNGGGTWAASKLLYESPYFRSLNAENAHIRMAVSDGSEDERIYAVWDDRPQKRIFLATSPDGGVTWDSIREMIAPQANLRYQTPYNADVNVLGDKVLTTWFVGDMGARCTPYSWSSSDGGETWGEQVPIFSESAQCPEKSEFIPMDPDYSVELFTIQGNLSISAWNGEDWSDPQVQTGTSSITNPATFETVLLACEQVASYMDRMFVVGCDEGAGKDIWFIERQLEPLDSLFPLPSQWSDETNIISTPQKLSSLSSVVDNKGNVHAFWVQSAHSEADTFKPVIQYARWDGTEWTMPTPIITDLSSVPPGLSLGIDSQQRLLLSWVDQQTGELRFSWSSSERANIPLEWAQPVVVAASSTLTGSPTMLVDASDRIVIAYAITLNEGRGIYIIQSTDQGETWSDPVQVFDAAAEKWEMVDQPKLAVTTDGTLHLLFTQYEMLGQPEPVGLYYSQSTDGGVTWSPAETVSEQPIQWSELVAYHNTLHRLWQEKHKSVAQTNQQVSHDSGKLWDATVRIPSDSELNSRPAISVDGLGNLYFVQVKGQDSQVFEEWQWSEERWQLVGSRKVFAPELSSPAIIESGITPNGILYALLPLEKMVESKMITNISGINRSIQISKSESPPLAAISTPSMISTSVPATDLQPTLIPTSPLAGMSDPQPEINRNLIGIGLIALVVLFILILVVPKRTTHDKTKRNKA